MYKNLYLFFSKFHKMIANKVDWYITINTSQFFEIMYARILRNFRFKTETLIWTPYLNFKGSNPGTLPLNCRIKTTRTKLKTNRKQIIDFFNNLFHSTIQRECSRNTPFEFEIWKINDFCNFFFISEIQRECSRNTPFEL